MIVSTPTHCYSRDGENFLQRATKNESLRIGPGKRASPKYRLGRFRRGGDRDPQLGITKAGNVYLRSLLIECANHILRPHGKDSPLREWGLHLASRGGKQAKNKAVVAVARRLAVLLHRIWTTQEPYIPFYAKAA